MAAKHEARDSAFPIIQSEDAILHAHGLTLRQYIATQCLAGMIAHSGDGDRLIKVKSALEFADELLRREKLPASML